MHPDRKYGRMNVRVPTTVRAPSLHELSRRSDTSIIIYPEVLITHNPPHHHTPHLTVSALAFALPQKTGGSWFKFVDTVFQFLNVFLQNRVFKFQIRNNLFVVFVSTLLVFHHIRPFPYLRFLKYPCVFPVCTFVRLAQFQKSSI